MLVLSRKKKSSIYLPSVGVEIKILDIQGQKVYLGVSAPRDVAIYRDDCTEYLATQSQYSPEESCE